MTTATLNEISNSSDLLWDLICDVEDGKSTERAALAQLVGSDRVIFAESMGDIRRKARAACPSQPRASAPPAFRASYHRGVDYEARILAGQGY